MSPEIQEWSYKSRSRINNLYLLTCPIAVFKTIAHLHQYMLLIEADIRILDWLVGVGYAPG